MSMDSTAFCLRHGPFTTLTYIGGIHNLWKCCEKRNAQNTRQLGIHTFIQEKNGAANGCNEQWRLVRRSAPTAPTRRDGCAHRFCCVCRKKNDAAKGLINRWLWEGQLTGSLV